MGQARVPERTRERRLDILPVSRQQGDQETARASPSVQKPRQKEPQGRTQARESEGVSLAGAVQTREDTLCRPVCERHGAKAQKVRPRRFSALGSVGKGTRKGEPRSGIYRERKTFAGKPAGGVPSDKVFGQYRLDGPPAGKPGTVVISGGLDARAKEKDAAAPDGIGENLAKKPGNAFLISKGVIIRPFVRKAKAGCRPKNRSKRQGDRDGRMQTARTARIGDGIKRYGHRQDRKRRNQGDTEYKGV